MSHTACRCQGALAGAPEAGGTDALSVKSWYRKGCEVMLVSDRVSLTLQASLLQPQEACGLSSHLGYADGSWYGVLGFVSAQAA